MTPKLDSRSCATATGGSSGDEGKNRYNFAMRLMIVAVA
jgi:hypothetical protein